MSSVFCCGAIMPYRNQRLQHEAKFKVFMEWAAYPQSSAPMPDQGEPSIERIQPAFAIQLVRQVNYGALESKRYFIPRVAGAVAGDFVEVSEEDLIRANFQKLNTYKNWKCTQHDKFFETNVYQKNPINQHHWRHNIDRPATEIDL